MSALVLGLYGPLTFLLVVVVITPQLTVSIRRLHDTDRSGWWLLPGLVPMAVMGVIAFVPLGWMVVGLATAVVEVVFISFLVLDGTAGPNLYCADGSAARRAGQGCGSAC